MSDVLVMAVDIGSSSVRASLYDANARPVPGTVARIERTFRSRQNGASEMSAKRAFDETVAVIDGCLERSAGLNGVIGHVAIACFWHSLMGIDEEGKPATPVMGWADTRGGAYTARLRSRFDERVMHDRVGVHFHSSFWPAKLMRSKREDPETWVRTARWVSFSDYLMLRLTGRLTTSTSMASGTGLFDIQRREWDRELMRYLKISRGRLPPIDDAPAAPDSKFAKRWPRLADAKWHIPIADGVANSIGSGCVAKTRAALMLGTSGALRVLHKGAPPAKIPSGLWCYRVDPEWVIVGGALSDGGNLIASMAEDLDLDTNWQRSLGRRKLKPGGPIVLPFFFGERSTGYHETAEGSIHELSESHDRVDIMRAAMEGIAFRFAEVLDRLQHVVPIDEIVLSGGAFRAFPFWKQIVADVFGRNLLMSDQAEATSRGAAISALGLTRTAPAGRSKKVFHSKAAHHIYRAERKRHQQAYTRHFGL